VAYLLPFIEDSKGGGSSYSGKILMATVKGDVHDIGKNIVGVVLGCNNYEIIDLGVMVPTAKIIEVAKKENVDIVGLSGLITPSLDEMVNVAKEFEREGLSTPLLIGGATTSRVHTAVKIEEHYKKAQTVHVLDASRSVPVVAKLLSEKKEDFVEDIRKEYSKIRVNHEKKRAQKKMVSIEEARKKKFPINWDQTEIESPKFVGEKVFEEYPLEEIAEYIDWTPFFQTWELAGRFPNILQDNVVGQEAQNLYADAQELLKRIIDEKWLTAKAVIGIITPKNNPHNIFSNIVHIPFYRSH